MCLESGELASKAKENMSVFGVHFNKVLNNHRPIDYTVLDLIKPKLCLIAIDISITFNKVTRAINKLKKGKSPGLNGIPWKHSKQWTTPCNKLFTVMFPTSSKGKLITKGGTKADVSPCQNEAT